MPQVEYFLQTGRLGAYGRDVFSARISKLNKQYDDNNKIEIKNRRYAWLIKVY
jgi:hypothetical protein